MGVEHMDYEGSLVRLAELLGRHVIVESRAGGPDGPFRLLARGVLQGSPRGQGRLSGLRPEGEDRVAFVLDDGAVFAVDEDGFAGGRWEPGEQATPVLTLTWRDSALVIAAPPNPSEGPATLAAAVALQEPAAADEPA